MRLLISGGVGGTNVGDSLHFAAQQLGWESEILNTRLAMRGPRFWQKLHWHVLGRRHSGVIYYNHLFCNRLRALKPDLVITTGISPISQRSLALAQAHCVETVNYSTDDPWNTDHFNWRFIRSIASYSYIFSPRYANLGQFRSAGAKGIDYLPFAYDERYTASQPYAGSEAPGGGGHAELLFVGAGDEARRQLLRPVVQAGVSLTIHGSFWDGDPILGPCCLGQASPERLAISTKHASMLLIALRRRNRDGHTMRTFEAGAIGGCIIAEESRDHREIFGEHAVYFQDAEDIVRHVRELRRLKDRREEMAKSVRQRIRCGANTYRDRLVQIAEKLFQERFR